MNCTANVKKIRSHTTGYCLIEVVTKAGLTLIDLFTTFGCLVEVLEHLSLSCLTLLLAKLVRYIHLQDNKNV